jgi:all-trans-8'-apo-beta-carotenal 15,15'-oxygenase
MDDAALVADKDLAPRLENWFWFDARESSYTIEDLSVEVPEWLRGAYYVNGPARFSRGDFRYGHWLDGDGMVCALKFSDEGVRFSNRFVRTAKLEEEERAGRVLFRTFGTSFAGDRLRRGLLLESPVNVSVYPWRDKLLAFGEQTPPVELDPDTLETVGEYDFGGRLNEVTPFAAHPKFDRENGHLVNFGVGFSSRQPAIHIFEFDLSENLVERRRIRLDHPFTNHDMAISSNYSCFFLSPLMMDFERFQRSGQSVIQALDWKPNLGSRLLIVPRPNRGSEREAFQVEVGAGYCLHMMNAFEQEDRLVVDVLQLERPIYQEYQPIPDLYQTKGRAWPVRFTVDLFSRKLADQRELDFPFGADFPALSSDDASRPYDDFWMLGISQIEGAGRKFFDLLVHGAWSDPNWDMYRAPAGQYLGGEPVVVRNPEMKSDARLIVQRFDAVRDRVDFLLFDPYQVAAGPIGSIPLREKIHAGFHASFRSEVRG